jgi:hypothetical protein
MSSDLFLALLLTGFASFTQGCDAGCTKAEETEIQAAIEPLTACVLRAAEADFAQAISDPISLVGAIDSACASYGKTTAAAVVSVIESWFRAAPRVPDAGDAGSSLASLEGIASKLLRVHDLVKPLVAGTPDASPGASHD